MTNLILGTQLGHDSGMPFTVFDTTTSLAGNVTFTRASNGCTHNSVGTIISNAVDIPRIDYNPTTLAARGLLIEGARTNIIEYSTEYSNAAWTKTNSNITSNAAAALDGTASASKFYENGATASHFIERYYNVTSGSVYSVSVFAKAAERSILQLRVSSTGTTWGAANEPRADFDLANGTVTSVTGGSAGTCFSQITSYGNGWYRCVLVATAQASTVSSNRYYIMTTSGGTTIYAGDGSSGVYIWGSQFEVGAYASSYVPTTGASATRAADICTLSSLSSIGFNATEGTFVLEVIPAFFTTTTCPIFTVSDGTVNNRLQLFFSSAGALQARVVAGGVAANPTDITSVGVVNTVSKVALAYKVGASQTITAANGVLSTASSPASLASAATYTDGFKIGSMPTGIAITDHGIWIRKLTYYPTRLPNATLQALTA